MISDSIKLLSTDFDGTLVDWFGDVLFPDELGALLAAYQQAGSKWVINTGRTLPMVEDGLAQIGCPTRPDFVIASERELYAWDTQAKAWVQPTAWNDQCLADLNLLYDRAASQISTLVEVATGLEGTRVMWEDNRAAGLVAATEKQMDQIVQTLEKLRQQAPMLNAQRNSVYMRFCHSDYSKGSTLSELARHLNLSPEDIFAVGDHFNDISMLDGQHAHWAACPANAVPEVKAAVRRAQGYVAGQDCGLGVLEALDHFRRCAHPADGAAA
ncbi:MAG: HAD family hydrolase [Verrucomicrobiales bacterium]